MKRLLLGLLLALPLPATVITSAECERGASILRNHAGCEIASPFLAAYPSAWSGLHADTWTASTGASALVFPGTEIGRALSRAEINATGFVPGSGTGLLTIEGTTHTATLGGGEWYETGWLIAGFSTAGTFEIPRGVDFPISLWSEASAYGLGGVGAMTYLKLTAPGLSVVAPEPTPLVLVGLGLVMLRVFRRRRGREIQ